MFQHLLNNLKYNRYHLFAFGFVAIIAHPLYWFLWTYIFPNQYENISLRIVGVASCIALLFMTYKQDSFRKILPFYWLFMVIYNLPFFFTVNLIKNNLSDVWLMAEIVMIFVVILFIPNIIAALIAMFIGVMGAVAFCLLTNQINLYPENILFSHSIIYALAVVAGYVFNRSNVLGIKAQEEQKHLIDKANSLHSLAGSISHELRGPLGVVGLAQNQSDELLAEASQNIDQNLKEKLADINLVIATAVREANNTIDIILADMSEKPIDPADFACLNVCDILPEIVGRFGYKEESEKQKVRTELSHPFTFKAIPTRLSFIVYNLLKNALYYLKTYPDSIVTVGAESRVIDGVEWNAIYVHDTGPGVPADILPKLFGNFFTSGKKEGTGLGLAFCKRNMLIFGGDIICESEVVEEDNQKDFPNCPDVKTGLPRSARNDGIESADAKLPTSSLRAERGNPLPPSSWTKFSLLFPKLSEEEISKLQLLANTKKILIIDETSNEKQINNGQINNGQINDEKINNRQNLINIKSKIETALPYIACDIATSQSEAITLSGNNEYKLILLGENAAMQRIKQLHKNIPIITYPKKAPDNILFRTITKWLAGSNDNLPYLGNKEQYQPLLQNKNILLADDQQVNRMMVKRTLERCGAVVVEAADGKELLELYQKSLENNDEKNTKSKFDLIITDINMPPHNGDEAAKEIRKIEAKRIEVGGIENGRIENEEIERKIPIIALSGDGKQKDIHNFFASGMNDYFIKGSDPELLVKIVANYLLRV